jgi:hypothetical protein
MQTDLIESAIKLLNVRYVKVSSTALLFAEGLELLPDEIQYIWNSQWNAPKILYILSRYTAYVDLILSLNYYMDPKIKANTCVNLLKSKIVFKYLGIVVSELILIIRTYAIYNRSKLVLYTLLALWTFLGAIVGIVATYIYLVRVVVVPSPFPSIVPGCYISHQSSILVAPFIAFLAFEILIVIMTLVKGYRYFRTEQTAQTQLLVTLYRDGVLYFIILMFVSLGNVILLGINPPVYSDLLATYTRAIHAILCCRILLNLRGTSDRWQNTTGSHEAASVSEINFEPHHQVIDILAHLDSPSTNLKATIAPFALESFELGCREINDSDSSTDTKIGDSPAKKDPN